MSYLRRCSCGTRPELLTIEVGPYVAWVMCPLCNWTSEEVVVCQPRQLAQAKRQTREDWNRSVQVEPAEQRAARHAERADGWRPAPFGRIRKVPAGEAARWRETRRVSHTARRRDWTPRDVDRLHAMVEAGQGYDAIAAVLRRTRVAVVLKAKRLGVRITTTPATLSARDVAVLLGCGCAKTVTRWITHFGLPASNAGQPDRPLWRVAWDDLLAWLEQRETWMMWTPERITDPDLQVWARHLRAGQGCWLSPGEVAERLGVGRSTPHAWVAKGEIRAVRYGNWWIWSEDLDRFTLPADRTWRRQRRSETLSSRVLAYLDQPRSMDELATVLGVTMGRLYHTIYGLRRRGHITGVAGRWQRSSAPTGVLH